MRPGRTITAILASCALAGALTATPAAAKPDGQKNGEKKNKCPKGGNLGPTGYPWPDGGCHDHLGPIGFPTEGGGNTLGPIGFGP